MSLEERLPHLCGLRSEQEDRARKATGMPNPVAPSYENIDKVLDASDNVIDLLGRLRLPPRLALIAVAITLGRLCKFTKTSISQALLGASLAEAVKPFPPVKVPTYEDEDSLGSGS